MDRKLDEGYPLKSTLLYIAVPLVVTTIALARAAALSMSRVVVLSVGGVLICIPWGIPGVIICAAIGAGVGLAVGMAVKYYLRQHQPAALRFQD